MPTEAANGSYAVADSAGAETWSPGGKRWRFLRYWDDIRASPWHHQVFVCLVFLQLLYAIAERIVLFFAATHTRDSLPQDIWFFGMILMTAFFVAYYGVHAIVSVNAFELVTFFVTSLMMLLRLVVEYVSKQDECYAAAEQTTCLGFLVTAVVFNGSALLLGGTMYNDLKWKRYRSVGAEVTTRRMYTRFELFTAVKNLDIQFSLVILFTGLVFFSTGGDDRAVRDATIMNAVLFLVELLFERAGNYGVQREHVPSVITFWALSGLMPAFVIYVAFNTRTLLPQARSASILGTIAAFAGLAVANRIATVVCSIVLYRSFGEQYRGLRRLLERDRLNLMSSLTFSAWQRPRGPAGKPRPALTPGAVIVANPVRTTSFVTAAGAAGVTPVAAAVEEEPKDAETYLDRVDSYLQGRQIGAGAGDIELSSMNARGEAHRAASTQAPEVSAARAEAAFHEVADATIEDIEVALTSNSALEAAAGAAFDVTVSQGVLTLSLGSKGTYVINKQTPNRQLWWSSPVSGPRRYEFNGMGWVNTRDGHSLHAELRKELRELLNVDIQLVDTVPISGSG